MLRKPTGTNTSIINIQSFFPMPILRIWESLKEVTCCRSLVVVYNDSCMLQIGFAAESSRSDGNPASVEAGELVRGSLCQGFMKSGARK